jgi:hypothetical protein
MLSPQDALDQITEIRWRMSVAQGFAGYRAGSAACTALLAIVAAGAQYMLMPATGFRVDLYLLVWLLAACGGLLIIAASMLLRLRHPQRSLERSLAWPAIEAFLPSLLVGALLTYGITYHRERIDSFSTLPGIWMMLFAMGVLASRRHVPAPIFFVGAFYLLAGVVAICLPPMVALSPWTMGLTFFVGQAASAWLLYRFQPIDDVVAV